MATGRIRRSARRGLAVAVLGWLGVAAASVLAAPPASAAASYVVQIKDLTPPIASVDKNGTVRFINEIPNKTVQVGGGGLVPSLVSVNATTQVILTLPSGDHPLEPAVDPAHPDSTSAWDEVFPTTCTTCKITYKYELSSGASMTQALSDAAIRALPPLPLPTPFVVNTLIPLPNAPSLNLPKLPQITVPGSITGLLPTLPVPTLPKGGTVFPKAPGIPTIAGIPGNIYAYNTGAGAPQMAPAGAIAASGFDSRYFGASSGSGASGGGSTPGSAGSGRTSTGGTSTGGTSTGGTSTGGRAGGAGNPGVTVPVLPQRGAVDLNTDSAQQPAPIGGESFPGIALAAVLLLGAVTVGLVRTFRAARSAL